MTQTTSKPLPNTTYAVLGILSFGRPLSGYEIRKWAENLHHFYWSPAQSQIYSELRRLEKLGLVTSEMVPQAGKPDKRLYAINPAGQAAFREWINEHPLEPIVIKHGLALRLFFAHAAEPGRLEELLNRSIEQAKEALSQLYIVEEYAESDPAYENMGLVALWGQNFYKAEIATAEAILARLAPQG